MTMKRTLSRKKKRKTQEFRRKFKQTKSIADLPIPTAPIAKLGHNLTPEEQLELLQFQKDVAKIDVDKELATMDATQAAIFESTLKWITLAIENHNREMEQKGHGEKKERD